MDSDEAGFAAVAETTSFLHYFSELPDHRQPGKVDYPLPEVLLLILLLFLRGRRRSPTSLGLENGRLNCCGGSDPM